MSEGFHRLRVLATEAETDRALSVQFEVPPALREQFRWRAGQHITLRFQLGGAEQRRSYSISEAPGAGPLRITVKRVAGGLVSNHVNDHVRAGDALEAMPPFGGFWLEPQARARRSYYFIGAGSGITPLYAMIRAVLAREAHSMIWLVYGNSDHGSIIFREALARLEAESEGRLTVRHALSAASWLSADPCWRRSRIDAAVVADFIREHPPYAQDAQYYLCGPGDMNHKVRAALMDLDVPATRIHRESYGATAPPDDSVSGMAATATLRLGGATLRVPVKAGQTLLEAARAAGATPPFSCEAGVCGACRAQLREGRAHLRARMALEDAELARGVILTCQALPTSARLSVDYD